MKKISLIFLFAILCLHKTSAQIVETITINIGTVSITDSIVKPHLLGVIAGPSPNHNSDAPDLTAKFQDIGISSIRNNDYQDDRLDMERMFFCGDYNSISELSTQYPDWNCDPNDTANYHFETSDLQFKNIVDGGFLPFFRLGGEFNHVIHPHDYKGPRNNEELNWIKASLKVINRYNNFNGGSNTLKDYLNIWTEYPQKNFWDRDSIEFNNFWCTSYDSLKSNFPTLKIGGPGFNTSISTKLGNTAVVKIWIDLFLKELYLRNLKPDWIGFHVFSNDIEEFYNAAINYRKLLRAEPPFSSYGSIWGIGDASFFSKTELICDAWGFDNDATLSSSARDSLFNGQQGAAHHVGVYIALQHADIERAYLYRGGEMNSDTTKSIMGLFHGNSNGSYKPAAYGFKLCSSMQKTYTKKLITPVSNIASGGSKIWTLAGEDSLGNKAILISNPSANIVNLSLNINSQNLTTVMYPYINHHTVTDTSNGLVPISWSNGVFVLYPYTSHLITMSNDFTSVNSLTITNRNINLYPNPSTNLISFSENLFNVTIFDAYGQTVFYRKGPSKSVSTVDMKNGIYFLRSNNINIKFVVQH